MIGFVLGLLVVGIVLISALTGLGSAGYDTGTDLNAVLKSEGSTETFDFFNMAVMLPVVLIGLIVALLVLFSLFQIISNPKGSIKGILGLLLVAVMFFVFYSMAAPETTGKLAELHGRFNIGEQASKIISGGIKTTGILFIAGIILMFVSEIINLFK